MALNYETLEYKPQMKHKYGDGTSDYAIDLLTKTWGEWTGAPFISPMIVNKYYVARPDLISLAVYGNDQYGDMICKFNGISNPFELNEGMLIQIPPLSWAREGCEKREFTACERLSNADSIQPKDNYKASRTDARSSSTPTVGDEPPYIIDRSIGLVIY